jgi:cyanophycinase
VLTLIAIGGALDLGLESPGLREFYRRAGGETGKIAILPTASNDPDAGQAISQALQQLGLRIAPKVLPVRTRQAAFDPQVSLALRDASAIFFTGGDQLRITSLLGGTPLEYALQQAYSRGALVAGSSAGAAALGQTMIAYGKSGASPRQGMAQLSPGLGLGSGVIIDQHFRQRDRIGRLIFAVACNPGCIGVGVDENTAAILECNQGKIKQIIVVGTHTVTVLDGREMASTDLADLQQGKPLAVSNLRMHLLTDGCSYTLASGQVFIPEKVLPVI